MLAVSAFGQPADAQREVQVTFGWAALAPDPLAPPTPATWRTCTGVRVSDRWILTAASCSGSGGFTPGEVYQAGGDQPFRPLKVVTYPERDLEAARHSDNLMLIHTACLIQAVAAGDRVNTRAARIGDVPRLAASYSAEVVPIRVDGNRMPIQGNAFKRAWSETTATDQALWDFASSDEVLGAPMYVDDIGAPMYFGQDLVAIYSGKDGDRDVFVDVTTKREWITKTIRDETLWIPGVCNPGPQ